MTGRGLEANSMLLIKEGTSLVVKNVRGGYLRPKMGMVLACSQGMGPCAMGRSVNPTFHSQMSTPDHPLHQIT